MSEGIKKAGVKVGARGDINLVEGSNITITVTDDSDGVNDIDVTIAAAAGGSSVADGPGANTTIDTAGAAGVSASAARVDHGHRLNTYSSAAAAVGTAAAGTSGTAPARGDHVHPTGAGTPSTQAFSDAAATGTGPAAAMTDHKHAWPALGTSAAAVGTSAGGSATTPSKSDHVHATGAGTPSTQAFSDAAAVGTGPAAAMTDHKHAMMASPLAGASSIVATVARTNDATEDIVVTRTIAANEAAAATTYKIWVSGYCDLAASAPNLIFHIYLNGTGGTLILTHTITSMNVTGSGQAFVWEGTVTVRTAGAPGTCIASSRIDGFLISSGNTPRFQPQMGASSAITTTGSNTLDVGVKWANAIASNKWAVEQATIELVKA